MATARANRRLEEPRERVLATALDVIAEQGLASLTMARLGARLGTSGGHLLYYFGTKDRLLLETLRWSESGYAERRAAVVEAEDLAGFVDLYLPEHASDPRWLLWLELWARAPYDEELASGQRELDLPWREALERLVTGGVTVRGKRARAGLDAWLDGTLAMLDGFSIAVVTGAPVDRAVVRAQVAERAARRHADDRS